jgi:hypothetical protein
MSRYFIFIVLLLLVVTNVTANLDIFSDEGSTNRTINIEDVISGTTTSSSGNITTFLDLTDTPDAYTGQGGKCVTVKATEDGVEFLTCGVGGGDFSFTDFQSSFNANISLYQYNYNQTILYTNGTGLQLNNFQFNISTDYLDTLYSNIQWNYNQTTAGTDLYVNEAGDTMTGDLNLSTNVKIVDDNTGSYMRFRNGDIIFVRA